MATWPGTLPTAPEGTGYQEQPPNTSIRSTVDAGPPKVRQRFTAGVRPFTMTWLLSKAQVDQLDVFYVTTLGGGSLSFDGLLHPRKQTAAIFRFVEPPAYAYLGPDVWRASTKLEILP